MLFSTYHWQPLLNGYSDNFPPDFHASGADPPDVPQPGGLQGAGRSPDPVHRRALPALLERACSGRQSAVGRFSTPLAPCRKSRHDRIVRADEMKLPRRRLLMAALLAAGAAASAHCGGSPVQPPPPPPPNTAPVVRSVTANRTQVDAGQEVEITAVAEDAQTPAELLTYEWTAEPAGGRLRARDASSLACSDRWSGAERLRDQGHCPRPHAERDDDDVAHPGQRRHPRDAAAGTDVPRRLHRSRPTLRKFCVRNFTDLVPW